MVNAECGMKTQPHPASFSIQHSTFSIPMPSVSVLMSVFNCEAYLAEAVRSVLAQTYRDFEFLIVNDGSTDHSLKLLHDFAAQDDRIRLINRPNTGITRALNEMI